MAWRPSSLLAVVIAALLCGCSVKPWVKPYERELLADPIMNPARDPLSAKHLQHVFETREGARGGGTSQGGGCGCN